MRPADGVDVGEHGAEARPRRRGIAQELDPEEVGGGAEWAGGGGGAAVAADQRRKWTVAVPDLRSGVKPSLCYRLRLRDKIVRLVEIFVILSVYSKYTS